VTTTTARERIDPKVLRIAVALIVGSLAVSFDTTIISVALDTLSKQLHVPISTIQWVSTGYLLALGVAIPLAGWAQARFGGKRVWLFAVAVFLIGSILCSLAWSAASLIVFRVVQGLGGGLMMPLFSTMIMQAAAGRSLGRTMSIVTLPFVIGPIAGPVIGGAILNSLDWRWLFWVNVPFCVAGFLLARRMLDPDATNERPRFDAVGWLLLSPGLVAILLALTNSSQVGGFSRADALGPLLAGAVRGFGLAAVSIPLQAAAFVGLRRDEIPHAGIITRIAQQIGGSFGVAVLALILDVALRSHSGSAVRTAAAFNQAFWWAVGFTGVALVLSLMLPGRTPTAAPSPRTPGRARVNLS